MTCRIRSWILAIISRTPNIRIHMNFSSNRTIKISTKCEYMWPSFKLQQIPFYRLLLLFVYLKAGLLDRSQYASGRPFDLPNRPRFPWFYSGCSKCWVGNQNSPCTACFSCNPPQINYKHFQQSSSSSKVITMLPPQTQHQAHILHLFRLLHSPNNPFPIISASSVPSALPCFQTSYIRRKSGYRLEISQH